jgi:hypothetical protein
MTETFKYRLQRKIWKILDNTCEYDQKIWLAGDGRSGTTWVSNLINYKGDHRVIFEPFHPDRVPSVNSYRKNHMLPIGENDVVLESFYNNVFRGKNYSSWCNVENSSFFYKNLIVKDVFSNLIFDWVIEKNPTIKPLFLIRNPYAVAISKNTLWDWQWQKDISFIFDDKKIKLKLGKKLEKAKEIINENTFFAFEQFLLWCVINSIVTETIVNDSNFFIYYEEILEDYTIVFKKLGLVNIPNIHQKTIEKPSFVSKENYSLKKLSPEKNWISQFGCNNFDSTQRLIDIFEINDIYNKTIR